MIMIYTYVWFSIICVIFPAGVTSQCMYKRQDYDSTIQAYSSSYNVDGVSAKVTLDDG
jgi:hypothetical protein